MPLIDLKDPDHLPALDASFIHRRPALGLGPDDPKPKILLLYGSLRERSFSRLVVEEAARLLQLFGAETRIYSPRELPLPDQVAGDDHPAVHELRELSMWSEGHVWCSPERHGQISGLMKMQIDHLPLEMKGMRPTQGRTLAVMQVSGGSQSFNAVNTLRSSVSRSGVVLACQRGSAWAQRWVTAYRWRAGCRATSSSRALLSRGMFRFVAKHYLAV
jgi:arsenic resistance protein ArsH